MVVYFIVFPLRHCFRQKNENLLGLFSSNKNADSEGWKLHRQSVFLCDGILFRKNRKSRSVGQSLSALCTSSLEDVSSVSGLHSLSEAVLLFSLTLFRLISSKHWVAPPLTQIGSVSLFQLILTLLHNDILHYNQFSSFCQGLFTKK